MKLIECPRDAMQGMHDFIPTEKKVEYINALLRVGFDTIDFGSFVSPKAIPQMRDTAEVLKQLNLSGSRSKLLAIVANERGLRTRLNFRKSVIWVFRFRFRRLFSSATPIQASKNHWAG
jgi:hydroxymethylglutaryl-CoA lyase